MKDPPTPHGPDPWTTSACECTRALGPHLGERMERGPADVTLCTLGDGRADPKPPAPPSPLAAPLGLGGPIRGERKRGENCGRPRGHNSPAELVRALSGALSTEISLPPASLPPPPRPRALNGCRSRPSNPKLRALNCCPSDRTSSGYVRQESREPSLDAAPSRELVRLRAVIGRLSPSVALSSLLWGPSLPSSASKLEPSPSSFARYASVTRLPPNSTSDSLGTDAGAPDDVAPP